MFPFWKIAAPHISVLLIAPSKYDDQGFIHRYLKGVISTSGLLTIACLTKEAFQSMGVKAAVRTYEDSVFSHAVSLGWFRLTWFVRSLLCRCFGIEHKLIVGLVSVQSHQYPRATDLIHRWQQRGATCIIGGPHVTGSITAMLDGLGSRGDGIIPCPHKMPPELESLQEQGVIIFHGEAEPHADGTNALHDALSDIVNEQPNPLYRGGKPDLSEAPLPILTGSTTRAFSRRLVPIRTSAGCPFSCKYCSGITIQGRKMRCRSPKIVLDFVHMMCDKYGQARFFITDDNFGRNIHRNEILNGLAQMREQGEKVSFMVQVDVDACLKDEKLIPALSRAGCGMVFMGIETLNQQNLAGAGKTQNLGRDLQRLFRLCHDHEVIVHAAYMIGFPHDTPASVADEVDRLHALGADHTSFYIRGDIPGSEDWIRLVTSDSPMESDLNKYDSHHCVNPLNLQMTDKECEAVYQKAWRQFYSVPKMIEARKRFSNRSARWGLLLVHLWYWWATRVENTHPMIAGFYRFRPPWDKRPGTPTLALWKYTLQEAWRHMRYFGFGIAAFYVFQHSELETEFALSNKKSTLTGRLRSVGDWTHRTFGQATHRGWLNEFWVRYARNRWQLLNPLRGTWWHLNMLPYAVTEIVYSLRFAYRFRYIVRSVRT